MLHVVKQLQSAVLDANPNRSESEGAGNESVAGKTSTVGAAVQVSVEVGNINLESSEIIDTESSKTPVEPSDQADHNTRLGDADGINKEQSSGNSVKELVDEDFNDSLHEERFEEATVWLKRVVSSLAQFEDQWVELEEGRRAKSKVV